MEIVTLRTIRKIIFICLLSSLFCCKKQNKEEIIAKNVKNNSSITNNVSCFTKQEYLNGNDDKELIYKFKDEIYEIKRNQKQTYDIVLNGKKYLANLNLESAGINFYYYKCHDKKILLIEGDDYYSSVFFIYLFENKDFYYLGDFYIKQPTVEKSGILKKDFNISFNNNEFIIDVLVEDKFFKTFNLKERKSIDEESLDSNLDIDGLWRLNCANSLTTFDISGKKGYLSLYSDNAIYINVEIINIENKIGEYYVRFINTESQQNYDVDKKSIVDNEISKSENIGKLVLKNDKLLFYWRGLYNNKLKKIDFERDFVLIKENEEKNPIILSKCE
ncbi:hypothetical protein [Flavobacterium hercynium]|uniref:Uncharacterized protein n=1 Tax=Flavobacterium hercynium TaxID=387094 RepID=A0A226H0K4_9FLAO|nr:hypothetical protein [Flavobacterium hercynium]OXA87368.1 hypothetical protein B0A66_16375 [Flavobacterium hercynium]SMP27280.1 hypothetical protein SAMN06265346_11066 [Flavobacterium hercynium]